MISTYIYFQLEKNGKEKGWISHQWLQFILKKLELKSKWADFKICNGQSQYTLFRVNIFWFCFWFYTFTFVLIRCPEISWLLSWNFYVAFFFFSRSSQSSFRIWTSRFIHTFLPTKTPTFLWLKTNAQCCPQGSLRSQRSLFVAYNWPFTSLLK